MRYQTNNSNKETMNKAQLNKEIKNLAKEENITFLHACSLMQSAAAKLGNEKMISIIHQLKMESEEMKSILS